MIRLDIKHTSCGASEGEILSLRAAAESANTLLHTGEGAGNDFLGWVNLPSSITAEEITAIKATAARLAEKAEFADAAGTCAAYYEVGSLIGLVHVADEICNIQVSWRAISFQFLRDVLLIVLASLPNELDV